MGTLFCLVAYFEQFLISVGFSRAWNVDNRCPPKTINKSSIFILCNFMISELFFVDGTYLLSSNYLLTGFGRSGLSHVWGWIHTKTISIGLSCISYFRPHTNQISPCLEIRSAFAEFTPSSTAAAKNLEQVGASLLTHWSERRVGPQRWLEHFSHGKRLRLLGFFSPRKRRLRGDLILSSNT